MLQPGKLVWCKPSAAGSTILPESFNSENVYTVVFTKDGETATLQKGDHN